MSRVAAKTVIPGLQRTAVLMNPDNAMMAPVLQAALLINLKTATAHGLSTPDVDPTTG